MCANHWVLFFMGSVLAFGVDAIHAQSNGHVQPIVLTLSSVACQSPAKLTGERTEPLPDRLWRAASVSSQSVLVPTPSQMVPLPSARVDQPLVLKPTAANSLASNPTTSIATRSTTMVVPSSHTVRVVDEGQATDVSIGVARQALSMPADHGSVPAGPVPVLTAPITLTPSSSRPFLDEAPRTVIPSYSVPITPETPVPTLPATVRVLRAPTPPAVPQGYIVGRGLIGQPKLYKPGQPVRNFIRYLSY